MKETFILILNKTLFDSQLYFYKTTAFMLLFIFLIIYFFILLILMRKVFKDIEKKYNYKLNSISKNSSEFDLARYITNCFYKNENLDHRKFSLCTKEILVFPKEPKKPRFYSYSKYKYYLNSLKIYYKKMELICNDNDVYKKHEFNYDIKTEKKINIFICVNFYLLLIFSVIITCLPFFLFFIFNAIKIIIN